MKVRILPGRSLILDGEHHYAGAVVEVAKASGLISGGVAESVSPPKPKAAPKKRASKSKEE